MTLDELRAGRRRRDRHRAAHADRQAGPPAGQAPDRAPLPRRGRRALRVVGHGPSLRFENRAGGADLNPYFNAADVELAAFAGAVTDCERFRGFERL